MPVDANSFLRPTEPSAFVFSHPNHEAAVLGTICRLRPSKIIYMTDGGGQNRVDETKRVLSRLGLADNAAFLNLTERSAYSAILNLDVEYFRSVAKSIRSAISHLPSPIVFCDAVEFYNPVHDMTLPTVIAARAATAIIEVPLASQDGTGATVLQKPINTSSAEASFVRLSTEEKGMKTRIVASEYPSLRKEMGTLIDGDSTLTDIEWCVKDRCWPIVPKVGQFIRYDARGTELVLSGIYERAITYRDHYVPLTAHLLED